MSHSIKPLGATPAAASSALHEHHEVLRHCGIDEETIEAYAAGQFQDPDTQASILKCPECQERVAEIQRWDEFVRKAHRHLLDADPPSTGEKR